MSRRYLTAAALHDLDARLSPRDLDVLKRLSDLRFLTGAQLTRLCFTDSTDRSTNARSARRALLRLTRLDVLARLPRSVGGVRAGSAGFVFHLGLGGQALAARHGWQPERRRRRSLAPGTLFLRHTLQVAELHVRLIEADRSRSIELLALEAEPSCWRSFDGLGVQCRTLKPDSYARLGVGDFEDSYFIEIDRGTEGSRALESQLRQYIAYAASGVEQAGRGVFPKCLWLANSAGRVEVIVACVQRLPVAGSELFQVVRFEDTIHVLQANGDDISPK